MSFLKFLAELEDEPSHTQYQNVALPRAQKFLEPVLATDLTAFMQRFIQERIPQLLCKS